MVFRFKMREKSGVYFNKMINNIKLEQITKSLWRIDGNFVLGWLKENILTDFVVCILNVLNDEFLMRLYNFREQVFLWRFCAYQGGASVYIYLLHLAFLLA